MNINLDDHTVRSLLTAYEANELSVASVVESCLARIKKLDRQGPCLNAMAMVDDGALDRAKALDDSRASAKTVGPLFGVPIVIKDNIDVAGLPTTGGSAALQGLIPKENAPVVTRLVDAGAVILGKSNMSEFAFGTYDCENSLLGGPTRNPYSPAHASGGSSGGTGVAIAAGYCLAGLGTDTGCSVRAPAAINSLVGLRPTHGLFDMAGIMPMNADWDTVGPLAKTADDIAVLIDVLGDSDINGETRAKQEIGHMPSRPMRVGMVRHLAQPHESDPQVVDALENALAALRESGVEVVDPLEAGIFSVQFNARLWYMRFRHDIESYLADYGDAAPHATLRSILDSGMVHPRYKDNLNSLDAWPHLPAAHPNLNDMDRVRDRFRSVFADLLTRLELDAMVFPTFRFPPVENGGVPTTQAGEIPPIGSNNYYASLTGFPALSVPMGYTQDGLPLGLQMLGLPHTEGRLVQLASVYQRSASARRSPTL